MQWFELTIRVFVSYFVLLAMTRLMGKKQLSHLTFFNYVTGITIGSMASSLAVDENLKLTHGVYSLILWSALTVMMEFLTLKSIKIRYWTDGRPVILIKHGEILKSSFRKTKYNLDEFNMMIRKAGIFDMQEIDYAILENNGELTILKKVEYQNLTKQDYTKSFKSTKNLPTLVVNRGKVSSETLEEFGLNESWLEYEANKKGYKNISEIYYAEIGSDGQLFIMPVKKDDNGNK